MGRRVLRRALPSKSQKKTTKKKLHSTQQAEIHPFPCLLKIYCPECTESSVLGKET